MRVTTTVGGGRKDFGVEVRQVYVVIASLQICSTVQQVGVLGVHNYPRSYRLPCSAQEV